jgi:hypothetical protein
MPEGAQFLSTASRDAHRASGRMPPEHIGAGIACCGSPVSQRRLPQLREAPAQGDQPGDEIDQLSSAWRQSSQVIGLSWQ